MMFHIVNALLLLPLDWISELLPEILPLLSVIDQLCKLLPETESLEAAELEGKDYTCTHRVLGSESVFYLAYSILHYIWIFCCLLYIG